MVVSKTLDTNMTFVRPKKQKTPIPARIMRQNMLLLVATEAKCLVTRRISAERTHPKKTMFFSRLFLDQTLSPRPFQSVGGASPQSFCC